MSQVGRSSIGIDLLGHLGTAGLLRGQQVRDEVEFAGHMLVRSPQSNNCWHSSMLQPSTGSRKVPVCLPLSHRVKNFKWQCFKTCDFYFSKACAGCHSCLCISSRRAASFAASPCLFYLSLLLAGQWLPRLMKTMQAKMRLSCITLLTKIRQIQSSTSLFEVETYSHYFCICREPACLCDWPTGLICILPVFCLYLPGSAADF